MFSRNQLVSHLLDARRSTLKLVEDLDERQLMGTRMDIVNPLLWEIGHCAWFQEKWALRHLHHQPPLRKNADQLYDSSAVAHDTRWDLPLYSREATLEYMQDVLDEVIEHIQTSKALEKESYFYLLALFHEDMHTEAFTYTRQTHGYKAPDLGMAVSAPRLETRDDDVEIPETDFLLGAPRRDSDFVFDNEQWAFPVNVSSFKVSCIPVRNSDFLEFVQAGGYGREKFWCRSGWEWKQRENVQCPVYWREEEPDNWMIKQFDRWKPLDPRLPVIHVNWYEADAYCRWKGRRLPTEAEWELAASGGRNQSYPWGDETPDETRVHMDWRGAGVIDPSSLEAGRSRWGCQHMIGNVWEWTSSNFEPYPGFAPGPYKEYSEPWFGSHKVLRGGCWATRSRLIRNTYRNYYPPHRRDVFAGFRTCALEEN